MPRRAAKSPTRSRGGAPLRRAFFSLLAPAHCAECGAQHRDPASADPLCAECHAGLPWLAVAGRCRLCQGELARDAGGSALGGGEAFDAPRAGADFGSDCGDDTSRRANPLCASCRASPSELDACLALTAFEGAVERWITRFKYPTRGLQGLDPAPNAVLRALARELAEHARCQPADRLIPIPLHPRRLRARGFNPAGLIARELGRALEVGVDYDSLQRVRDTPSQTGLSRAGRRRNVAGIFAPRAGASELPERVWLVDDVVTTGATLAEAARTLRRQGARLVIGLCIARTPLASEPASDGETP